MSTAEIMKEMQAQGCSLQREQYATTNRTGRLISGHRWIVLRKDGSRLIHHAYNPRQAYKLWKRGTT